MKAYNVLCSWGVAFNTTVTRCCRSRGMSAFWYGLHCCSDDQQHPFVLRSLHPHSTHLDVLGTRHVISFDTGQRLVRSGTRLSSPGLSHALHPYFSTV